MKKRKKRFVKILNPVEGGRRYTTVRTARQWLDLGRAVEAEGGIRMLRRRARPRPGLAIRREDPNELDRAIRQYRGGRVRGWKWEARWSGLYRVMQARIGVIPDAGTNQD